MCIFQENCEWQQHMKKLACYMDNFKWRLPKNLIPWNKCGHSNLFGQCEWWYYELLFFCYSYMLNEDCVNCKFKYNCQGMITGSTKLTYVLVRKYAFLWILINESFNTEIELYCVFFFFIICAFKCYEDKNSWSEQ